MSNQFGHNRDRQRVAAAHAVARQLGNTNHNAELVRQLQSIIRDNGLTVPSVRTIFKYVE